MGPFGSACRVLGPIVGNILNYTSLQDTFLESLSQYSLDLLKNCYHISRLTPETKIYALLEDPIEASRGHFFHNEIFYQKGIPALYIKLRLRASELTDFFRLAAKLPFGGFSVTMPLKEEILPFLTEIDPEASAIGAVNTVVVRGSHLYGTNTDGKGALNALESHGKVKGKILAILGAGGSARAIAYEAMQREAEVILFNRTISRAKLLAKYLNCKAYPLDALSSHSYDYLNQHYSARSFRKATRCGHRNFKNSFDYGY